MIATLLKGDIITCPKCEAEIAEVMRDVFSGERIQAEMFRGIQRPIEQYQLCECIQCHVPWFNPHFGSIHLKNRGWTH